MAGRKNGIKGGLSLDQEGPLSPTLSSPVQYPRRVSATPNQQLGKAKSTRDSSSISSSWRPKINRPSFTAVLASVKVKSASQLSAMTGGIIASPSFNHIHQPGPNGQCPCETNKNLRERVIEPNKVPTFLIPTINRPMGGSVANLRMPSQHGDEIIKGRNSDNQPGMALSSSFVGGMATASSINDLLTDEDRSPDRIADPSHKRLQKRGSAIYSSLDDLIYGTTQTNELIKRSSTELINDLVQIIAPETTKKNRMMADFDLVFPSQNTLQVDSSTAL